MAKWTADKAWEWYNKQPWLCGFNYIPRTAVNWTEMWQKETFDLPTIRQELSWAKGIGYNTLRTTIPFIVWQDDRDRLLNRLNEFLNVADENGLITMLSLLDDCGFSGDHPYLGPQKPPTPGLHNSQAAATPGRNIVMDQTQWPAIEAYVKDIISVYGTNERILLWDLYNEPGNYSVFKLDGEHSFDHELEGYSYELMKKVFSWAREIDPIQPLTTGGWHILQHWEEGKQNIHTHFIDVKAFELSDIITFHAYCSIQCIQPIIENLKQYNRPIMCTEWLARHVGSHIEDQLILYHQEKIGCYHWGFVNGKTQTHIPWPGILSRNPELFENKELWFHDMLTSEGKPFSKVEVATIKRLSSIVS